MVAVVLYYIATSIGMVIERQRGEIALLKSRGGSTVQIIGIYLMEGLLLGGDRVPARPADRPGIAQLIGTAYGFLQFAKRPALALTINDQTIQYAGARRRARALARACSRRSARRGTRSSATSRRSRARPDCRSGSGSSSTSSCWPSPPTATTCSASGSRSSRWPKDESLVIDPLLLIVPSVFIFACALLFLRLFPLITALLGRLTSLLRNPVDPARAQADRADAGPVHVARAPADPDAVARLLQRVGRPHDRPELHRAGALRDRRPTSSSGRPGSTTRTPISTTRRPSRTTTSMA